MASVVKSEIAQVIVLDSKIPRKSVDEKEIAYRESILKYWDRKTRTE